MRPATAPAGSRMTASVSESQISSPPRRSETSRSPAGTSSPDSRSRCSTSLGGWPSASSAGTPVIRSAARVPEHDLALAVDGHDPVGDVGEDRHAALLLERDALVELGARERGRRVAGERRERLDLLLAPGPRGAAVDREHALHRSLGADERHGHAGGVAGGEHRVGLQQPLVLAGIRDRDRRARLDGVAGEPRGRGDARVEHVLAASSPIAGRGDELVAVEQADHRRVGVEQRRRLADDLVEHGGRVELGGEQRAGARELLRQRRGRCRSASNSSLRSSAPRAAPARLRASSRSSSVKRRSSAKKTSTSAHSSVRGASTGTASSARVAALARDVPPLLVEALVVVEPRRGEHAPVARGRAQRPGRVAQALLEELHQQAREVVQPVQPQVVLAAASARPRCRRRARRRRPGRARRRSPRARSAGRARRRSGRSRAGSGPGACARRSSPRCGARARRGSRRPRAAPRRPG